MSNSPTPSQGISVNRKAGNGYSVFSVGEFDLSQFKLMDKDSVSVDSTLRRYQNMVEVKEAVLRPGMFHLGNDISTVKSLIEAVAGLKKGALAQHAVMHRMKADRTLEVQSLDINGILEGTTPDVPLLNEDVIKQAGGLTKRANPEGTKLLRLMTPEEHDQMEVMLRTAQRNSGNDTIDVKKLVMNANYPVGIEMDKALENPGSEDDPILRDGDRIIVPHYDGTVKINGEVLYPNTVRFKEGKNAKYHIDLAGGTTSTAKESRIIIIYMNGMVAKADRKHKPAPGCQIVVPTKRKGRSMGLAEWLTIGSSTASIATMIATIANLVK